MPVVVLHDGAPTTAAAVVLVACPSKCTGKGVHVLIDEPPAEAAVRPSAPRAKWSMKGSS